MKVVDKRKTVAFENLKIGEVFKYNGNVYMKTEELYDDEQSEILANAASLDEGNLESFGDMWEVIPLPRAVLITDELERRNENVDC